MFLNNAWYVAALPGEVGDTPLARTILDQPVVLWRQPDGTVAAIEDRCCHRHLPLSLGKVCGERIQCGYHGLEFDASGTCVRIPGQEAIPSRARVRSYRVYERWNYVWIWMGDPFQANTDLIPKVWWADDANWKMTFFKGVPLNCDYRLIADNVLDATHLTYVHASSIGSGSITEVEPVVEHDEQMVRVSRWMLDVEPPPAYAKAGDFPGNVDRLAAIEYRVPNFCVNFANCYDVGCGGHDGDPSRSERKVEVIAVSLPTPVTATTCNYYFAFARSFGFDDPDVEAFFNEGMFKVFEEDFIVLESQQQRMTQFPDISGVDIRTDLGPNLARRILKKACEAGCAGSGGGNAVAAQ